MSRSVLQAAPPPDALDQRDGLPAAFRYLAPQCPRAGWPTQAIDPGARHWLDVHGWFRGQMDALDRIGGLWREGRADAAAYRAASAPRLRQLLTNLHHHHQLETSHAFPILSRAEPRMAAGFALLDRDHDLIDARLNVLAESANALIRWSPAAGDGRPFAEALADRTATTTALIARHLDDEEEIVVPVMTLREHGLRF